MWQGLALSPKGGIFKWIIDRPLAKKTFLYRYLPYIGRSYPGSRSQRHNANPSS
jgi:hypothetical protein